MRYDKQTTKLLELLQAMDFNKDSNIAKEIKAKRNVKDNMQLAINYFVNANKNNPKSLEFAEKSKRLIKILV